MIPKPWVLNCFAQLYICAPSLSNNKEKWLNLRRNDKVGSGVTFRELKERIFHEKKFSLNLIL